MFHVSAVAKHVATEYAAEPTEYVRDGRQVVLRTSYYGMYVHVDAFHVGCCQSAVLLNLEV